MQDDIKRLYRTSRWQAIRQQVLTANPLCTYCEQAGRTVPAYAVDHITPHRGNLELFWSGPFQGLCEPCHNGVKQREDNAGHTIGVGVDGWPTAANHPANTGHMPAPRIGTTRTHPDWFRQSYIPLTIVCGPPGSGKSRYVTDHAKPNDLVICFDTIAVSLFGKSGQRHVTDLTGQQVGKVLHARNEMLADLMRAAARDKWQAAWLIVSEPIAKHREWWAKTVKPQSIVVLETPANVCAERIKADAMRGDKRRLDTSGPVDWWVKYSRRDGDLII